MEPERSLSAILTDIVSDVRRIMRAELLLAKTEIREESRSALVAGKGMGAGVICLYFGVLFLLIGVVAALSIYIPVWAAALIVAGLLCIVGFGLIQAGRKRMQEVHLTPRRALDNLKENFRWAKQQTR